MAEAINKKFYYVLNKVDGETKEILLKSVDKNNVIAAIPNDRRIFKNCLEGEELDFKVKEIGKLADLLEGSKKVYTHAGK